jgi:hypothetical protein
LAKLAYLSELVQIWHKMLTTLEEENRAGLVFTEIVGPTYLFQFVANGVEFFLMGENHYQYNYNELEIACDAYRTEEEKLIFKRGVSDRVTIARFLYAWFLRTGRKTDFFLESVLDYPYAKQCDNFMITRIANLFKDCLESDKRDCSFNENERVYFHATDYRGSGVKSRYFTLLWFFELMTYPTFDFEEKFTDLSMYDVIIFTREFDKMIRLMYEPFILKYGSSWIAELTKVHYLADDFKSVLLEFSANLRRYDELVETLIHTYPDEIANFVLREYKRFVRRVHEDANGRMGGILKTGETWTKARHQLKQLDSDTAQSIVDFMEIDLEYRIPFPSPSSPQSERFSTYREYRKREEVVGIVTGIMDVATLARMMRSILIRKSQCIVFYGGPYHTYRYVRYFKMYYGIADYFEIKDNRLRRTLIGYPGIMDKMNGIEKCTVCANVATLTCNQCKGVFYCSAECGGQEFEEHTCE